MEESHVSTVHEKLHLESCQKAIYSILCSLLKLKTVKGILLPRFIHTLISWKNLAERCLAVNNHKVQRNLCL